MQYSIGSFDFVMLTRLGGRGEGPELLGQEQTIISRPGPDSVNVRKDGIKGRPFQMRSTAIFSDAASVQQAHVDYRLSQSEVGTLVWEGANYTTLYGVGYVVLHVGEPVIEKMGPAIVYGQDRSNWWKLQCVWDLLPVDESLVPTE